MPLRITGRLLPPLQMVQNVNIAGCDLPLRHLKEYDSRRPMEDEGSTGGGQGRHRIILAEYDDETIVLKGYALVSFLVVVFFVDISGCAWRLFMQVFMPGYNMRHFSREVEDGAESPICKRRVMVGTPVQERPVTS